MSKSSGGIIVIMALIGTLLLGTVALAAPIVLDAHVSNYGQCHKTTEFDREQAPGQNGTGPSTTTPSGEQHKSAATDGWQECRSYLPTLFHPVGDPDPLLIY